jgi:hypothetical protein
LASRAPKARSGEAAFVTRHAGARARAPLDPPTSAPPPALPSPQLGTLLFGKAIAHNFDIHSKSWYFLSFVLLSTATGGLLGM